MMTIKKSSVIFFVYFIFCYLAYHFYVFPVVSGDILPGVYPQLYFDSLTYHQFVQNNMQNVYGIINLRSNYAGPFFIIKLLKYPFFIFMFNCFLFIFSFKIMKKSWDFSSVPFLFLFLLNPIIFVSVLSVNKESVSVLVTAFLVVYARGENHKVYGLLALLFAFFVRWQLMLFVIFYLIITSRLNPFSKKPLFCLFFTTLLISFFIPFLNIQTSVFSSVIDQIASTEYSGGVFQKLLLLEQIPGGYMFSVIPKTLHLLFGVLLKNINKVFDFSVFTNNFIVYFYSAIFLFVFLKVLLKRKFNSKNPLVFLLCLYLVFFVATPIYAPRYFLPVYIILLVLLYEKSFFSNPLAYQ